MLYPEVSEKIIQSFYHVYHTLGYGFLEKVYENSIRVALRKQGLEASQQLPIAVHFEGEVVGEYFADLLVDRKVVIELKAAETIAQEHEAQLLNYLRPPAVNLACFSTSTKGRIPPKSIHPSLIRIDPRKSAQSASIRVPFLSAEPRPLSIAPKNILYPKPQTLNPHPCPVAS
jgi:GxxExxY protein